MIRAHPAIRRLLVRLGVIARPAAAAPAARAAPVRRDPADHGQFDVGDFIGLLGVWNPYGQGDAGAGIVGLQQPIAPRPDVRPARRANERRG